MKYFCCSDIHSFGQILKRDLATAGFDVANPEHVLIVCGDIFDRGPDTLEVYDFLISLPAERRVLVRGNHEALFMDLLDKNFPGKHDFSNGTVRTFCHIAGVPEEKVSVSYWIKRFNKHDFSLNYEFATAKAREWWQKVRDAVQESDIAKFVSDLSNWVNYFELPNYVFVHSFVPTKINDAYSDNLILASIIGDTGSYDPNWRSAMNWRWEDATWGCPWKQFKQGGFIEDKTLVVGHWHTSGFFEGLETDLPEDYKNCPIYNNNGLVGLDACTVITNHINVFIIEN